MYTQKTKTATEVKNHRRPIVRLTDICKKNEEQNGNVALNDLPCKPFAKDDVKAVLLEYADSIKSSNAFLYNVLEIIDFDLTDKHTITFHFANKVNEETFNSNAMEITTLLKEKLCNGYIEITSNIVENVVVSKPYTDSEKLDLMIKKNENIKYLKDKLNLQPEF